MELLHICLSDSDISFGGYNPEKDVNLETDTCKTAGVLKPQVQYELNVLWVERKNE